MEKQKIDYVLFVLYLTLAVLGLINIYSAKFHSLRPDFWDPSTEYGKQFIWILVSIAIGFAILILDVRWIYRGIYQLYVLSIGLLFFVLFTEPINGSKSWFRLIPGLSFQPAELAKLSTCLVLARYLSTPGVLVRDFSTKLNVLFFVGLPSILILLQPDAGTFLVFVFLIFMLYREGLSGDILGLGIILIVLAVLVLFLRDAFLQFENIKFIVPAKWLIIFGVLLIGFLFRWINFKSLAPSQRRKTYFFSKLFVLLISSAVAFIFIVEWCFTHLLKSHQKDRINLLLGLIEDKSGVGYNIHRALTAIGSGNFWGKGYRGSILANDEYKHVPEQGTDFIFCSIGEEWGFVGTSLVVLLLMTFILRIIWLAEKQKSNFSRIFAYSVASIFFAHFLINIGMVIGILPVIGIPLPFFSYGGSSFLGFSVLVFLLIRFNGEKKLS